MLNFGIDSEDTFGCEVTGFHSMIKNYQFDCTKKVVKKCGKESEEKFSDVCLSDKDAIVNEWKYNKLETIL